MKKNLIKISLVSALAASTLSLTACTDEQLALGAGVIIGAAIGSADNNSDHHHHRPPPPPPRHCDYGCGHSGRRPYAAVETAVTDDSLSAASHFQISESAAEKLMTALKAVQQKDFTLVQELGFTKDDITAMALGENPSASALIQLSQTLDIELGEAHNLIQQMKADLE